MKFVHIADLHLDAPFTVLNANNRLREKRREEQLKIFEKVINYIKTNKIEFLMEYYPSAGYTNEKVYIFVAKDFQKGKIHLDQTEEILSIKKIDFNKCLNMALNGEFEHASINLAILMYYFKEKNGGKDGRN